MQNSLQMEAIFIYFGGDPERILTFNRLIRSQVLYTVELRGLCFLRVQKYKKNQYKKSMIAILVKFIFILPNFAPLPYAAM